MKKAKIKLTLKNVDSKTDMDLHGCLVNRGFKITVVGEGLNDKGEVILVYEKDKKKR